MTFSYRPGQGEAIDQILEAWESRYPLILLDAPVGSGKSLIAAHAGHRMYEKEGWFGYLTTPFVPLVLQYANDPLVRSQLATIMGRRNYPCNARRPEAPGFRNDFIRAVYERFPPDPEATADEGYCSIGWPCPTCHGTGRLGVDKCDDCKKGVKHLGKKACPTLGECEYFVRRAQAEMAPLAVTTMSYLLATAKMADEELGGFGTSRDYLFIDEAHALGQAGVNEMTVTLRQNEFTSDLWQFFWQNEVAPILAALETVDVTEWFGKAQDVVVSICAQLEQLADGTLKAHRAARHAANVLERLNIAKSIAGVEWVLDGIESRRVLALQAQPVDPKGFLELRLWKLAPCKVLASGTFGDTDEYVDELGLPKDYKLIRIPSYFPPENGPVRVESVAPLGRGTEETALPKILARTWQIIEQEPERGLIHSPSYALAQSLMDLCPAHLAQRLVGHKGTNRNDALDRWLENDRPDSVFVGVNMFQGLDLRDDLARWQVILKAPFPSLGDRRIAARFKRPDGPKWYRAQAQRDLLQACGRIVRSASDHGRTYVLDTYAGGLLRERSVPEWARTRIAVGDRLIRSAQVFPWQKV